MEGREEGSGVLSDPQIEDWLHMNEGICGQVKSTASAQENRLSGSGAAEHSFQEAGGGMSMF